MGVGTKRQLVLHTSRAVEGSRRLPSSRSGTDALPEREKSSCSRARSPSLRVPSPTSDIPDQKACDGVASGKWLVAGGWWLASGCDEGIAACLRLREHRWLSGCEDGTPRLPDRRGAGRSGHLGGGEEGTGASTRRARRLQALEVQPGVRQPGVPGAGGRHRRHHVAERQLLSLRAVSHHGFEVRKNGAPLFVRCLR